MNMKFALGTKEYMTQIFDDMGSVHPVTVISAGIVSKYLYFIFDMNEQINKLA